MQTDQLPAEVQAFLNGVDLQEIRAPRATVVFEPIADVTRGDELAARKRRRLHRTGHEIDLLRADGTFKSKQEIDAVGGQLGAKEIRKVRGAKQYRDMAKKLANQGVPKSRIPQVAARKANERRPTL